MKGNLINILKDKITTLGIYIVTIALLIANIAIVFNVLVNFNLITKIIFSISFFVVVVNFGLFIFLYKKDNKLAKYHLGKTFIFIFICIISFAFEL